jgi:hypothetical protein
MKHYAYRFLILSFRNSITITAGELKIKARSNNGLESAELSLIYRCGPRLSAEVCLLLLFL